VSFGVDDHDIAMDVAGDYCPPVVPENDSAVRSAGTRRASPESPAHGGELGNHQARAAIITPRIATMIPATPTQSLDDGCDPAAPLSPVTIVPELSRPTTTPPDLAIRVLRPCLLNNGYIQIVCRVRPATEAPLSTTQKSRLLSAPKLFSFDRRVARSRKE
jgi:hypothetical protein